jgi:hypothetical protein
MVRHGAGEDVMRWCSAALLVSALAAGRAAPPRSGASCESAHDEAPRALDLRQPADRQHLTDDALAAEDLAIRYADWHRGHRSGHFDGHAAYADARDACMAALFGAVARTHEVTPWQVRAALGTRRLSLDLIVVLSFAAVYVFAAAGIVRWIRRAVAGAGLRVLMPAMFVASLFVSTAGVGLGEIWSDVSEMVRVGNEHLSIRASRVPWTEHRFALFAAGVLLFWLMAAQRDRSGMGGDPDP